MAVLIINCNTQQDAALGLDVTTRGLNVDHSDLSEVMWVGQLI